MFPFPSPLPQTGHHPELRALQLAKELLGAKSIAITDRIKESPAPSPLEPDNGILRGEEDFAISFFDITDGLGEILIYDAVRFGTRT